MSRDNRHAGALVVGDRGIMITGPSGAGKSTLALALIVHAQAAGIFARLVSDDQLFLSVVNGRVVARAPASIAGLVEAHGAGPVRIPHLPAAIIDWVVELVAPPAPRIGTDEIELVAGIRLPLFRLVRGHAAGSVLALSPFLGLPPFKATGAAMQPHR